MSTLIFDIETIGEDWSTLDEVTKHTLTRWVDRTYKTKAEHELALQDIKNGLGFSPLTGSIVALGLYDLERTEGVVYYVGETGECVDEMSGYRLKGRTEPELLEDFWAGIRSYDTIVTFNGRMFDVPFIIHRSIACGIRPTVDLMTHRYLNQQKSIWHVDLLDQLTFYGALGRRPPLHLFCRAYGIESPKAVVTGDDVAELFRQEQFRDIATYNARDVIATTALYETWLYHLAPETFVNRLVN